MKIRNCGNQDCGAIIKIDDSKNVNTEIKINSRYCLDCIRFIDSLGEVDGND